RGAFGESAHNQPSCPSSDRLDRSEDGPRLDVCRSLLAVLVHVAAAGQFREYDHVGGDTLGPIPHPLPVRGRHLECRRELDQSDMHGPDGTATRQINTRGVPRELDWTGALPLAKSIIPCQVPAAWAVCPPPAGAFRASNRWAGPGPIAIGDGEAAFDGRNDCDCGRRKGGLRSENERAREGIGSVRILFD